MKKPDGTAARPEATDETMVTEITLMPDGRVYVFGTSRGVLELLGELDPTDGHVRELLLQSDLEQP